MRQDNCQNIVRPHVAGHRHTTVAGDDFQILVQQDRIDKPELADGFAYLGDLHPVMQLWVVFILPYSGDFYVLYV